MHVRINLVSWCVNLSLISERMKCENCSLLKTLVSYMEGVQKERLSYGGNDSLKMKTNDELLISFAELERLIQISLS